MNLQCILMSGAAIGALTAASPAIAQASIPTQSTSGGATSVQETTPPVADEQNGSASSGDIIVTAQRRAENIQSVPLSVTALSAQELKARGLNDLGQISLAAPSLQVNNNNNFSVRGIGTLSFSTSLDTSVAISLDDVNLGKPLLSAIPFYDLASVEVLNGPQGLLFGKNASAGLLNVRTTRPELNHYGSSFELEATSRERPGQNAQGALVRATLNVPVTSNSALRIAGIYSYQQPVTRFVGPSDGRADFNIVQYGVRAKYLWNASSDTDLYVIADYNHSSGVAGFFDTTFRQLGVGSPEAGPLASIGIVSSPTNFLAAGNAPFYRDLDTGGAQATLSHTFANGFTLSDIAAWKFYKLNQQLDGDQVPGNGLDTNHNQSRFDQYTNELRLTLPAENRLSGQVGLFYYKSKIRSNFDIYGNVLFPDFLLPHFPFCVGATPTPGGPPNCSVNNTAFLGQENKYTLRSESYAAFGQWNYRILDGLQLIAGGRVTHDRIAIDLSENQNLHFFVPLGVPGIYHERYQNTNFSWKVGPQYQITPTIMAYANYGQGYKGPGFNDVPISATKSLIVFPETTKSFEAGLKTQFFDRRLTFNVSVFHTKFKNYQAQSFNVATQSFQIDNAASLISKGVELGIVVRPFQGLSLNGQASFLDTKFDQYPGAQCYVGQPDPSCAVDGTFNAGGLRAPLAPKFTTSWQATYEHAISGGVTGFVEANYYHRSHIYFQTNHAPGAALDATDVFGASIGVHGQNWRASLFCKNCTNEIFPVNISSVPFDSNNGVQSYYQTFDFNSVRTIGIRTSFQF